MSRVAIIGAGSSIGRFVLRKGDSRFVGIYRSARSLSQLSDLGEDHRITMAGTDDELIDALRGCKSAIICINDPASLESGASVERAVFACEAARIRQIIHIGSTVNADDNLVNGSFPTKARLFMQWSSYRLGKGLQELAILRQLDHFESVYILRPSLIWGPGMQWLNGPAAEVFRGNAWTRDSKAIFWRTNINLLYHAIEIALKESKPGLIKSNIYDQKRITWGQYYEQISQNTGGNSSKISEVQERLVPPWLKSPSDLRSIWPTGIIWSCLPNGIKRYIKNIAIQRGKSQELITVEISKTVPPFQVSRELWELKKNSTIASSPFLRDLWRSYPRSETDDLQEALESLNWL